MKKYIALSLFVIVSAIMATGQTPGDTILSVRNANTVIVSEGPQGIKVTVKGNEADPEYVSTFEEKYQSGDAIVKSKQWINYLPWGKGNSWEEKFFKHDDITVGGLCVGFVKGLDAPAGLGLEMGKSFEISLLNMLAWRHRLSRRSYLSVGFGMDWRTYRNSKGTAQFVLNDEGKVTYGQFPDGVRAEGSQLKIVRAGFPVMWEQYLWKGFSVSAGVVLNMTTHASIKSKWVNEAGNKVEQYNGDLNTRFFTVDVIGMVRFCPWLGVYARWTPQSALRSASGVSPSFSTLSTGLVTLF